MLQERITVDLRKSMIEKDTIKRDLLRVVISEINRVDKLADTKKVGLFVSDEEIVKILKKGIESAKLCNTEFEIPILESYLPATISDDDLRSKLTIMINNYNGVEKNVGEKMKDAKELLGSDFDGKRVSSILKTL